MCSPLGERVGCCFCRASSCGVSPVQLGKTCRLMCLASRAKVVAVRWVTLPPAPATDISCPCSDASVIDNDHLDGDAYLEWIGGFATLVQVTIGSCSAVLATMIADGDTRNQASSQAHASSLKSRITHLLPPRGSLGDACDETQAMWIDIEDER